MTEEWREFPEDPRYLISSNGRVAKINKGKISHGYRMFSINNREVMIQRLVALTFHGPPPFPKADAAHDDGDKLNNTPGNIVWKTRGDNIRDKRRHGKQPFNETHHWATITMEIANEIRAVAAEDQYTHTEIAARFGVSRKTITRIIRREERGGWR